jgi:uncharacterized membrane protein YqjE
MAALTPPGRRVSIIDETFAPDDMNQDVDLVGITVMADLALRVYHIADTYRRKARYSTIIGLFAAVVFILGIIATKWEEGK